MPIPKEYSPSVYVCMRVKCKVKSLAFSIAKDQNRVFVRVIDRQCERHPTFLNSQMLFIVLSVNRSVCLSVDR